MEHLAKMTTDAARQAFGDLLERHRGIVLKVAHSYAWHPADRDELAQEIATQLWRAYPAFDESRSFSTWMYRIALNVAISHARSEGPRRRESVPFDEALHDVAADNDTDFVMAQRIRALRAFIAQIDPLNRALLLLYLEERSHREIADVLGITETNVATRIHRLKQRIRHQLPTDNDDGHAHGTR